MGPKKKSSLWYKATKTKKKVEPGSPISDSELEQDPEACRFCHSKVDNENLYGKFLNKDGIVTHYFCMLFASGLGQNGITETDGILGFLPKDVNRELSRGYRFKCIYCRKRGATIGCCNKSCRAVFHFNCGQGNDALNQFFGNFNSFCGVHRLKQITPSSDRLAFHGTAVTSCAICMCSVDARASNDTLRTPCCKNSWYHRECIQNQALSAGLHFFKCPLCNNKDNFQKEMLMFGIYIPDQDAAWEREDNAFQELLDRHSQCDIKICLSTKGRMFKTSGKFNIALCDMCGSQGTHLACSNLKSIDSPWECPDCKAVQANNKKKKVPSPEQAAAKSKSPQNVSSYLEEKGRSSYRPSTAFPAKKGQKRKCSAAEGRPSVKRCRIMECSVRLTSIDKQLEKQEICGKRCLLSPGRTSVKFLSKEQMKSSQLSEERRNSNLDISRLRKKLEAIKQQRLKMESAPSPSKIITSPVTGQTIETDNLRRKIQSLNDPSFSPFSNDGIEFGSVVKSSNSNSLKKSFKSEVFYTSPFPRKSSILSADSSMKSLPVTPKSPLSFGDRTLADTSYTFGLHSHTPSPSSSSDFTPKSSASFRKQTTTRTSTGSPVFIPKSSSSVRLQTPQSFSKSPGPLTGNSSTLKSINKFQVVSHDDKFSTPKLSEGCRTPQVEVSSAGTHVVHSECNSERINKNVVKNTGNKSWSTCSLHSVSKGLNSKLSLNHIHSEPRQSVKRQDFLEEIEKYGKDLKSTIESPGSQADPNLTNAGNSFRLYPSQVPLSKPEFDRLWSSSSSGSETEPPCQKRSSNKYPKGKWYYLPKGVEKVAKHSFNRLQQSGLRSSSVIKANVAVGLRRQDSKLTPYRSAPTSPGKQNPLPSTSNVSSDSDSDCVQISGLRQLWSHSPSTKLPDEVMGEQVPGSSAMSPRETYNEDQQSMSNQPEYIPLESFVGYGSWCPGSQKKHSPDVTSGTNLSTCRKKLKNTARKSMKSRPPFSFGSHGLEVSSAPCETSPLSTALVLSDTDEEGPVSAVSKPIPTTGPEVIPTRSSYKTAPVPAAPTVVTDRAPSPTLEVLPTVSVVPRESDPILPLVGQTHLPVVVIDDEDHDDLQGKSCVVKRTLPRVVTINSDDDDIVDLTADGDDDSDCVIESSSCPADQHVVSVPGHLQKNLTLFCGPANKVLIPVAGSGLSHPAHASIGVSVEPIVIGDDNDNDTTTQDDPLPHAKLASDSQGRPVGLINPFQKERR